MIREVAIGAAMSVALLAGCDEGDGRELRPAPSGATTTTTSLAGTATSGPGALEPAPPTVAPRANSTGAPAASAGGFGLTVPFEDGRIERRYSCDGPGLAPQIGWFNVPDGTRELALVVVDPDAGGFVHWVVTGLDPEASSYLPDAGGLVVEAVNSVGEEGWAPPCPPAGEAPHRYEFTLYAVGQPLEIAPGSPASDVIEAVEGGAISRARESATYGR